MVNRCTGISEVRSLQRRTLRNRYAGPAQNVSAAQTLVAYLAAATDPRTLRAGYIQPSSLLDESTPSATEGGQQRLPIQCVNGSARLDTQRDQLERGRSGLPLTGWAAQPPAPSPSVLRPPPLSLLAGPPVFVSSTALRRHRQMNTCNHS